MINFRRFLKGILIENVTDRTKEFALSVLDTAVVGTRTILGTKQTANRNLVLPDTSGELVELDYTQILTNKTIDGTDNDIVNVPADNITVTPSGNLTATDVQAALEELQTEIDSGVAANVVGPGSSTDNAVARFDGVTGKLIQNSGVTIDDSNNVIIPGNLTVNGTTTTVNTNDLEVKDKNITVNFGGDDSSAQGAGLTVDRTGTDGSIVYDSTATSKWKVGNVGGEKEIVTVNDTQTLTGKTIDGDDNTVQDLPITSLKTVVGNATKFLSFDGSGVPIATKTVPTGVVVGTTDTQTLSGKTIDGDDNTVQDLPVTAIKTVPGSANTFLSRDGSGIPISTKAVPTGLVVGTTDTQTLSGKTLTAPTINDPVTNIETLVEQSSTPANPASGFKKLYAKTNDKLYTLNSSGTEVELGNQSQILNVADFGAVGDGTTDDTAAIQACIDAAEALQASIFTGGTVYAPSGKQYKITSGLTIQKPIKVEFNSPLLYTPTTGIALSIGIGNTYQQFHDLYFSGIYAVNGLTSQPASVNGSGCSGVYIEQMSFSKLTIGQLNGFSNNAMFLNGLGDVNPNQVILHNTISLGQVVNCGRGVYLLSLDAATSCAEANRFYIQNVYQCFCCIKLDDGIYYASTSNTFYINAMDNSGAGHGISCNSKYNNFYVGYTETSVVMESLAQYNTAFVQNNFSTGSSFTDSGSNNILRTGPAATSQLPTTTALADNSLKQNNYGVPIVVYFTMGIQSPSSGAETVSIHVGASSSPGVVMTQTQMSVGGSATTQFHCISLVIPVGYYWKVVKSGSGDASYGNYTAIQF